MYIDGHKISDYNTACLRSFIGVVGQEPVLFSTSIGNIINSNNIIDVVRTYFVCKFHFPYLNLSLSLILNVSKWPCTKAHRQKTQIFLIFQKSEVKEIYKIKL